MRGGALQQRGPFWGTGGAQIVLNGLVIVDCKEWTPRPRSLVYATVIIAVMRQNSYSSKTRAALKGLNPSGGSVSDYACLSGVGPAADHVGG